MQIRTLLVFLVYLWSLIFSPLSFANESIDSRLMSLLRSEDYVNLDREVNSLIDAYSKDYRRERELDLALDTFYRADPKLERFLDGWVKAAPRSAAAFLSRGIYFTSLGWAKRGTKYFNDTTKKQLDGMAYFFGKAFNDFENARSINKDLLHTLCYQMEILMNFGAKNEVKALRDQALKINPYSVTARWYYISSILPRWGGSIDEIEKEVKLARPLFNKNPDLKIFEGRVQAELGDQAFFSNNSTKAIKYYSEALKFGNHWYYNAQRGEAYTHLKDYDNANRDFSMAIQLRPNFPRAYYMRAFNKYNEGKYKESIEDFTKMFTSDLDQAMAWDLRGDAYMFVGQPEKALTDFEMALSLSPGNAEYISDINRAKASMKATPAR